MKMAEEERKKRKNTGSQALPSDESISRKERKTYGLK
jgi:hypothetical protein